ncbi:MAG: hypothetical protein ACXVDC_14415, partial [Bacteroidia bacterium]
NQSLIAGTETDFSEVTRLLQKAGMQERILGRVDPDESIASKTMGSFTNLSELLKLYPVKEIIFCESKLSFKKIIKVMPQLPAHLRIKLFITGTQTLIGSGSKNEPGKHISKVSGFRLALPVNRRNKNLSDVITAFIFLITFPVHLIIK